MTKDQIKAKLTELAIPFDEDAGKEELEALLPEGGDGDKDSKGEKPEAEKPGAVKRKAHWPKGFVPGPDERENARVLLAAAPKVTFICPLAEGEKPGAVETVHINGYPFIVAKGQMVEIPRPVAELLAGKYRVEMEVMQRAQVDATPQKAAALAG